MATEHLSGNAKAQKRSLARAAARDGARNGPETCRERNSGPSPAPLSTLNASFDGLSRLSVHSCGIRISGKQRAGGKVRAR